ncbi:hypothetical protein BDR04DRAFT_383597 [Suillus decipiens]|nr:hypothetical protein BDR04DRAFT_383597 [Suillus decipiens]
MWMPLIDLLDLSTVPVRHLGLDLVIHPETVCCAPLFKDIEEITLTSFVTQRRVDLYWNTQVPSRRHSFRRMLTGARNIKRLTFWLEGNRDHTRAWAGLLFQDLHDILYMCHLEHVSCVVAGPDVSTSFDFVSGFLPILYEDNQFRGHRAANDVRKLMSILVLCCRNEENLCDTNCQTSISLIPTR